MCLHFQFYDQWSSSKNKEANHQSGLLGTVEKDMDQKQSVIWERHDYLGIYSNDFNNMK